MECSYFIEVKIKLYGSMFSSKVPPAIIPICILPPDMLLGAVGSKVAAPNNWNPTLYPNVEFMIPE